MQTVLRVLVCALAFVAPLANANAVDDPTLLRPLREDAGLHDVHFVDAQSGWAVGDRGTILSTSDGGRTWRLQESGVQCTLNGVWFVDANHGWACGAEYPSYLPGSTGVLLTTNDGGMSWRRDRALILPGLRQVRFFDPGHGWALGDSSALSPSGLSTTDDGGRSWSPVHSPSNSEWIAGDFADPQNGVAVGAMGRLGVIQQRDLATSRIAQAGLRDVRRVRIASRQFACMVGDGGLVMLSTDAGSSWQSPPGDMQMVMSDEFDLRALEVRGSNVWFAGSPGSRILFSSDRGGAWQAFPTGQNLPIHDVCFIDDQQGWVVGAFGLIMSTTDGGKSWRRQRGTATRAAILGILSETNDVPLELLARLSGNEGYLSAIAVLNRRNAPLNNNTGHEGRATAALAAVGAGPVETAWRFPLHFPEVTRSPEQWVAKWDRLNEGHAIARLEAHLVRLIRQWRPEIIITHAASLRGDDLLGHTVNQLVLHAAEQANDTNRFPEHAAILGLEPWRSRKLLGALSGGQPGAVNLSTSQLAPRLGASLADAVQLPRSWLEPTYQSRPTSIGFQTLIDSVPQGAGPNDFMSGLTLAPGGEARRLLADLPDANVDLMRRTAQKHRHLQAIFAYAERQSPDTTRLLGEMEQLTSGLDPRMTGDLLFQLGQHYLARGQLEAAAETMQMIASHHQEHPLAQPALTWLMDFFGSAELAWQIKRRGTSPAGARIDTLRTDHAMAIAKQIEHQFPHWFAEGRLQLPFATLLHRRELPVEATKVYQVMVRGRPEDAWKSCAAGEIWLADSRKGSCPKTTTHLAKISEKPRLDGVLDEPLWQTAKPLELRSSADDDSSWPAIGMLLYDDEFLYVGLSCRRAQATEPIRRDQVRPRDADLTSRDRVELLLDVDRDYATFYRLIIDDRGWVNDRCWHNSTWNPQWFVASKDDGMGWTAEAAIAWSELVADPPGPGETWAIQMQRIVPETGFQSWTNPASPTIVPEGFGYAIFD